MCMIFYMRREGEGDREGARNRNKRNEIKVRELLTGARMNCRSDIWKIVAACCRRDGFTE